jgi:hypothetical protein
MIIGSGMLWAGGSQGGRGAAGREGNFNQTGFPIVNERISLRYLVPRNPLNAVSFGDLLIYQE